MIERCVNCEDEFCVGHFEEGGGVEGLLVHLTLLGLQLLLLYNVLLFTPLVSIKCISEPYELLIVLHNLFARLWCVGLGS